MLLYGPDNDMYYQGIKIPLTIENEPNVVYNMLGALNTEYPVNIIYKVTDKIHDKVYVDHKYGTCINYIPIEYTYDEDVVFKHFTSYRGKIYMVY